jgi:DNA-nicking Smr family endonuclease
MGQKNRKPPTLDLHGFKADEVFDALEGFLAKQNGRGASTARVMTGKGKGIVQKIVVDYLKLAGYPWSFETMTNGQKNSGVMIVHLD